ncbi:MAG: hypothetical protein NZ699_19005 [Roseiflexus sp.]|nr:hypothetical protein [Roseiflexus sp.]
MEVHPLSLRQRWFYRIWQFITALTATIHLEERVLLVRVLSDPQLLLFERMPRFAQRHSLDVYHALVRAGYTDSHLLQAALLHDCGKVDEEGRTIPLIYHGLIVVLQRYAPNLYERAARHGRGLFYPFALHASHERRSVAYAQAVCSPPEVVQILRDYAERRPTPFAEALRVADDAN